MGGTYEVEDDVLGTGRVLEDGENCSHGASDVGPVKSHSNMYCLIGANIVITVVVVVVVGFFFDDRTVRRVVEFGGFSKLLGNYSDIVDG